MALAKQDVETKKKTNTQTVTVGGRSVNVNTPTTKPSTNTTKQNVTVGGREIKVDVPTPKYAQNKSAVKSNSPQNVSVGGRDITNQVVQQKKNEALNVPKSNPVIDKVKNAVNNVLQMAGVETGRMKLKNDYTAQRNQAKLESVNAQNMELANTTTPEMYSKMFTPDGQRVDNSKEIEGIRNEMAQLDERIAEIGNDDMAIAEISRRNELQEQLDAFDDLNNRAQAIEELSTQNWFRENGDEQGLAQYQEMLSHKNDNFFERSANALNHLGNTTANIIPTAFDQMEELGSNKMAMDSIATLEEMHNTGEIDDATYLESLAEWQDFIDSHKSTNSDNLSQVIRANADRLSANTYYGASDIEKFCLQAGESTAQFLLHFALVGEGATISMSLASGTDKMNQLLMQGVDPQTAAQNGLMTGLVSYATEKIGMDRFVNMMGTPFSADALGSIVLNQLKSGLSEGLEEVAEGLVDPLIDYATLGIPYEVNGDELKMEFLLGGASGLMMAVGGTVIGTAQEAMGVNAYLNERRAAREAVMNQNGGLIINTQYQKNQVIDEVNMLKKHYDTMTEQQKEVAREVIAKGENAVRNYEQMSQVQGVVLSTDIPETTSTEENNQAIYQTYTPDFNNEVRFEQKIKETESVIDELMKNQIAIDEMNGQTQQILNENGYDIDAKVFNSIDEKQQQQTLLAHDFAKALGYDVDIVNDLGKNIHGSRSKETGRITIDASMGKNPVLQTLAHEITHGTESGSRYDELKKLVRSNFTDEQWNAEIKRIQDVYKRNAKQELAPEDAEKEIVAKYVEHNLNDEQFIEDLIRYNFSLASRIKQNMKSFFSSDENQNFKTTYERVFKTARDEMIDKTLQAIKDGFEGMVGENYVSKDNLQMSVAQYDVTGRKILEKYLSDPENDISEESKNAILDRMEEVYKAMKEFEETGKYPQFSQWQDTFYSINDRGDLSVVINNGDYELNIDFSTVCKKRKMMDKVINALTKNGYLTKALKNTDIAKIREIIQKHKFEVACGLCFVDTKRFNQGAWAGRFETRWNKLIDQLAAVKDVDPDTFNFQAGLTEATPGLADIDFNDPRLASFVEISQGGSEEARMARALMNNPSLRAKVSTNDMYGSSGFEALQKANPTLFKLVNASGGSSKPKLAHTEVTYFNEIINSPKFNPEEARKVGGVRLQSFSDFMTNMVFDYVQMFGDMEAKNLTGHSYTKVKEYALLFGKTGMKINLSLIPAGFDSDVYTAEDIAKMKKKSKEFLKLKENAGLKENGDYMFDKESFDFDLAVEIQNLDGYDKNVGTICVGVSDKHILKLLGDDRICMVIPYHRSGISPLVADKMGISTFNDYTNKQNTRMRCVSMKNGKEKITIRKVGIDFNFYEGSNANGKHFAGMIENNYDAKKTADSYKAWCKENEYIPKFGDNPEILNHPNYYKLLIDFRAYDKNGNVAPQESVKISGDSGIGTEYVPLDAKANPKLAELYGDNIGFNNVLEKGLDVYESNEARQNEAIDPISQEVIDELGLERKQLSVDDSADDYISGDISDYRSLGELPREIANGIYQKYLEMVDGETDFEDLDDFIDNVVPSYLAEEEELGNYANELLSRIATPKRITEIGEVKNRINSDVSKGLPLKYYNRLGTYTISEGLDGKYNVHEFHGRDPYGHVGFDSLSKAVDYLAKKVAKYGYENYSVQDVQNENPEQYSVEDDIDAEYIDAVNNGDMETAQRLVEETAKIALKDSKVVDENGNLKVMYHSTDTPNFTKFDPSFSDDAISLFYTDDPEVADTYSKIQNNGSNVDLRYLPNKINSIEEFNKFMENKEDARVRDKFVKVDDKLVEELKQDDDLSWDDIDRAKGKYIMARKRTRGDWNYFLKDVFDTEEEVLDHIKNDEYWTPFRFGNRYKLYLDIRNPLVIDGGKNTKYDADITIKIDKQGNDIARLMGGSSYTIKYSGEMSEQKRFDTIEELLDYAKKDFGLTPSEEKKILKAYNTQAEPDNDWVMEDVEIGDREVNRFEGTHWNDINFRTFSDEASKYNNFKDASDYNKMLNDNFFANFKITEDVKGNLQVYVENKNGKTVPLGRFSRQNGEANELNKLMDFIQERLYAKALNDMKSNGSDTSYIDIISEFANKWGSVVNTYTPSPGSKTRDVSKYAKENGYDGVIFKNLIDIGGWDGYGIKKMSTIAVAFDPNQAKSADPVTYDDNGNVIPLSERFNTNNDDIRYSAEDDGDLTIDEKDLPIKNTTLNSRDMKKVASESKTAKVLDKKPEGENFKNLIKEGKLASKRVLVDKYAAVDDLAQRSGNKKLTGLVDRVMRSGAIASRAIYNGVVDKNGKVIGKSLTEIMGKIPQNEKQLFGEYMYHWRNVDEMSMVKRFGKDYTDKPVFGNDVTADDSMERIAEIEKTHPEFKEVAEEMWELYRNLLKIRLDAGIISQETYDQFVKERPHYVRIIRDVKGGTGGTALNPNDIKKFKGSTENIIPIEDATMAHIQSTYRVANNNELNSEILKTLGAVDEGEADDVETLVEEGYDPLIGNSKQKTLSAYRNGVKYSMEIGEELAKALTPTEKNVLMKIGDVTIAPLSQLRKAVITSANPIFTLFTNPTKDVQDAIRNTKYLKKYPRALAQAVSEIRTNGELSQLYDNLGIRASSYIGQDIEKAFNKINTDSKLSKFLDKVRNIGENIEKIPRLAEFIASLEAGNSVDQAAYDAAEITTNFKRGGTWVKTADKYGFTFLNASVQGFEKQIRNAKGDINKIKKNGVKGLISVLAQLTLASGLPLRMLLDYLWRDDDDYNNLSDYVKNNYYIIPNLFGMAKGEGKKFGGRFLRIPKGRIAAFYQTVLDNIDKTVKKQTDIWDALLDDLVSFENNLAPNNFLDNNMFSPLVQAYRTPEGRTWYGEDLVPTRLQDIPDYEQFDEGTDSLSIAIGQLSKKVADALGNDKFQISPYKLNYLFDQYTGFIGDVALPALTLETSTGVEHPVLKGFATAILDKFTTDPILKNQNVTSFYSLKEEMDKKAKGSEATDEEKLVSKYLGTVSSAMGKLYGEKRKIQLDPNLSNKEKLQRVREIQTQINDLARNALGSYDQIDMVGKYASVGDVQYYQNEDGSWTKPTSNALEKLNNADLSMEDRDAYFQTYGEIDKIRADIRSNTPKGEQAEYRDATIEAINNSKLSAKGKNAMYDSYYSSKFADYVNGMDLTDEQKYGIKVAKTLANSEKDANGKTIANSKAWATADAYKELGVLEDVLKYIRDNDIKPSDMGLSKTVYESLLSGSSSSSSGGKTSSKSSKKSSKSNVGGSAGGITRAKGGGSTKRLSMAANPIRETKTTNSFVKAYADVLKRNSSKATSSGNGTIVCPKCGNRVSSGLSRCPICGTSL